MRSPDSGPVRWIDGRIPITIRRVNSLWESLGPAQLNRAASLHGRTRSVSLAELRTNSTLGAHLESLRGRVVLLATREQLPTALALVELDGIARRLVLCTPDLTPAQLAEVAAAAEADAIVMEPGAAIEPPAGPLRCWTSTRPEPVTALVPLARETATCTEWVLLTSGTTGNPKLVSHTFQSLSGTLPRQAAGNEPVVWSTFYDIRRYGGLQMFLRAIVAGTEFVLSSADEPVEEFLGRAAAAGVTHISGTPSHWRRALMSGAARRIQPRYVRLSGEIADQAVLDNLRRAYPDARISHAFASTEAGVAFDVDDGLAGFPATFVTAARAGVEMKVVDGTLRIRSERNARRYLGSDAAALSGDDGFVDTGDLVELVGERYHFRGRRGGVINVGGLKVHPEEVDAVINRHAGVQGSLVKARKSPITGAIVVADVVLKESPDGRDAGPLTAAMEREIIDICRRDLAPYKVPAAIRFVPALPMSAAGKLLRHG